MKLVENPIQRVQCASQSLRHPYSSDLILPMTSYSNGKSTVLGPTAASP